MVTVEDLDARRAIIAASPDLQALQQQLVQSSERILTHMPVVPGEKALLSRNGGICPSDGTPFVFDPWSRDRWTCPACGQVVEGERHRRHWARYQHLWLAEQAASLAALASLAEHEPAANRAAAILDAYSSYTAFPNSDNVLGPARLFFSTYLESIWLTNWLAAAVMLRDSGRLPDATAEVVNQVADEAAAIIGDFDEGFSNRQVWHNAALVAVAVWFEDAELAERAIEGEHGLLALLAGGIGGDGMWHEGENYHLFALQGFLAGVRWARLCGMDLLADPGLVAHLSRALRAPMISALPDGTFPARKDARFGVSLAQPMYLELWEVGMGLLNGRDGADLEGMSHWLQQRYREPAPPARMFDSWLYEAGRPAPAVRSRASLSWNVLAEGLGALPDEPAWTPPSTLMHSQGLAILRDQSRYVSLEAGVWVGGHGHPDRLHLSLADETINWLPDPGTGSYVDRDLFWYRSTMAHNAPLLDGRSQRGGDAHCGAFDVQPPWAWVTAEWDDVTRTVVMGPAYVLDVVRLAAGNDRTLELPWHVTGVVSDASGTPAGNDLGEFVHDVQRIAPDASGQWVVTSAAGPRTLTLSFAGAGELLAARGPGVPGTPEAQFFIRRGTGRDVLFVTVLSDAAEGAKVEVEGGTIVVEHRGERHVHVLLHDGWEVQTGTGRIRLGGRLLQQPPFEPLLTRIREDPARGTALRVSEPPALDGSLTGFDDSESFALDHEDQYRRGESPYPGPETFGARAVANWDADALYIAVEVRKDDPVFRPANAAPLDLDNEPDDIHSDGLQVYLQDPEGEVWGAVIVPEAGGILRVSPAGSAPIQPTELTGAWASTDDGYIVTLALAPPFWRELSFGANVRFDLAVNQMQAGRQRRAGQLVWSGGGGWIYLRGTGQEAARMGVLDLT